MNSVISYRVVIPEWKNYYEKSKKTAVKYWLWKDRDQLPKKYQDLIDRHPLIISKKAYCATPNGERFIRNTKKAGKPNVWILNGQSLYSGTLNWRLRKSIAQYYHTYFEEFIRNQLSASAFKDQILSISCDIYDVKRGQQPDIDNMWPLEKFFTDALVHCKIIPNDSPDYVIESGRKRYHWVDNDKDRKLIFNIQIL